MRRRMFGRLLVVYVAADVCAHFIYVMHDVMYYLEGKHDVARKDVGFQIDDFGRVDRWIVVVQILHVNLHAA